MQQPYTDASTKNIDIRPACYALTKVVGCIPVCCNAGGIALAY